MTRRGVQRVVSSFVAVAIVAMVACSSVDAPPPFTNVEAEPDGGGAKLADSATDDVAMQPAPDTGAPPITTSRCPMPTTTGEPLTCAWLQTTKNCWAEALAVAATCPMATMGKLSADGLSCGPASNPSEATFSPPPVQNPIAPGRLVDFKVFSGDAGAACYSGSFRTLLPTSSDIDVTLTTPKGCVSVQGSGKYLTVTCPDGAMHTGNADDLACKYPDIFLSPDTSVLVADLQWGENPLGKMPYDVVSALDCHP